MHPFAPSIRHRSIIALLLIVCAYATAVAQPADTSAPKRALAVRITGSSPRVDGRLDDAAWTSARFVSDFRQKDPIEGAEPTERTELAIMYDDHAVYIGARLHRNDPSLIHREITRRDNVGNTERIIVSLDTYRDRRTAYTFVVTAAGGRADYYHGQDGEFSRDYSFDPVWEGDAHIDANGWTAEMRIPFSQLRFNDADVQVWGMNIDRWLPDKNEDIYWVVVPKNVNGWSSRMGEVTGIEGIRPSMRLELLPYVAADLRLPDSLDPDDPFGTLLHARAGLDIKMGVGPNLTLDATINPDFGQVEADPAQVNLTDFESFFGERRPFFIEGAQLLKGSGASYFYSRRIGAPPRLGYFGDYVDAPDNTTILAATKLTGRLSSGLSVGALAALTDRETEVTYTSAGARYDTFAVAPLTGFGVVRLQQEFGESQSTIGATATGVRRTFHDGDDDLRSVLADNAYTGGVDFALRFDGGAWDLNGYVGGSTVHGDTNAILRLQRSSARYFQRPDADYVEVDRSRESLTGYTASMTLNRQAGSWQGYVGGGLESPEFELNDAGQLGTADDIDTWAGLSYIENTPSDLLRNYNVNLNVSRGWNYGGVNTYQSFDLNANTQLRNYWDVSLWSGINLPAQTDGLSRGGPLMGTALGWYGGGAVSTPYSWKVRGWLDLDYNANTIGGWYYEIEPGMSAVIGDQWKIELNGGFEQSRTPRQYVTTLPDGSDETFGRRYVFSRIFQTTIGAQLRVGYVITPNISLDLYAEPFAATGEFYDYGELEQPGSVDIRRYSGAEGSYRRDGDDGIAIIDRGTEFVVPRSDFTYLSFRSNVVLRWEWLRGSTAYLVWQRQSEVFTDDYESLSIGHLARAIQSWGTQVIALKLSYWFAVD